MNASERIDQLLDMYELNAKALSEMIGMKRPQAIYDILNGKTKSITEKMAIKIISVFPEINKTWLLTGEGDVVKDPQHNEIIKELYSDQSGRLPVVNQMELHKKIPIFELEATAGFSSLYNDLNSGVHDYITIPNLPLVDGAIYARGDSMSPLIASGDIVIFKKVELIPENILWGHIYIISYSIDGDDYTVLKYIRHSSRDGFIRLESFNSRYDPQDIPSSSITALALVKASITFHTIG